MRPYGGKLAMDGIRPSDGRRSGSSCDHCEDHLVGERRDRRHIVAGAFHSACGPNSVAVVLLVPPRSQPYGQGMVPIHQIPPLWHV